ncbi:hypothetical protein [Sphingomonas sp. IC081]|uniref:hypothetical protein n=1 Tax=Sphingomonas sp. IC081 TaxID=304378 RepID=UPI00115A6F1C|nr:hypothetical protein [Sphingomonas sp. IC081]QDK34623.1 hypothetical protein DM450_17940 [Sphingomonas sp. IC081]
MKSAYRLPDPGHILPERAVAIRRHGFADHYRLLFISVVLGLVSIGTVVVVWPGLYADYRIRQNPVEVPEASLASSECKTKNISVNCKAGIAYPRDGQTQIRSVEFSFISLDRGDFETTVVAERGHPDNITLSLAIDELWNRFLGSLAIVVLLGWTAILMARRFIHVSAAVKAFRQPAVLQPVWARITMRGKGNRWGWGGGRNRITYFPVTGLRKGMAIPTLFTKAETPWMHYDPAQNETFALAALHPGAILPIMLDEAFDRLELTDDEVRQARVVRDGLAARIGE